MSVRPTLTFGICVAAGIAAGIGLARPGQIGGETGQPTVAASPSDPASGEPAENGYGAGPAGQEQASAAAPAPGAITIADFQFGDPISVGPGAAVEVTNTDGVGHTLTADGGPFDTGSISGGGTASFVAPTEPGTYSFFCSIHPSMQGAISVTG